MGGAGVYRSFIEARMIDEKIITTNMVKVQDL